MNSQRTTRESPNSIWAHPKEIDTKKWLLELATENLLWDKYSGTVTKKALCKWGQFDRAKTTLRILLVSWNFYTIFKGFRSLNAKNLGSVGQRAAKLLAIKLWEWFDHGQIRIWADCFECGRGWKADFFLRPPTLIANNFAAL